MAEQAVIFTLGEEEYGMPIEVVREITHFREVRSIPQAPPYFHGLINIRGQAVPLINLHIRLDIGNNSGFGTNEAENNSFALITEVNKKSVGFEVDKVLEVLTLDNVIPPPPLIKAPYIRGLVNLPDRIIILIIPEFILEEGDLGILNDLV
ncbi:MAG TPA: chemotaxis protein CheW [Desulfitobacteriaceae bacterium]|nr:chemotaxis protein CheW [Desulfitobacteriaceae bacterium]